MDFGAFRSLLALKSRFLNPNHLQHFSTKPRCPRLKSQIQCPLHLRQKSPDKKLASISSLLKRYGFPQSQLHNFLAKNRFLMNSDPYKVEKSLNVLFSLGRSQEFLTSVVSSCPSVLDYEFMKKWETGFSEVKSFNLSALAIKSVLEVCLKFELDPDDVLACLKCLRDLGFSDVTLIRVLEASPTLVTTNPDIIQGKVESLIDSIGIEKTELDHVLRSFPGVFAFGIENRLKPLLNEFKSLGFGSDIVRREVRRDPRTLGLEVGEFSRCLKFLRSLRCRVSITEVIFREGAFRAGFELKLRVDCLHKHGLIYRDAYSVLWKEPRAILYGVGEIERKIQFLVQTMKYDVECLVEVPEYLGVNFEKQIVPRFKVVEYLRSKGGLGDEVGLKGLIKPTRLKFYNLYVKPYPECESIYGRFARDGVKRGHPSGMWKLFKPPKYQLSEEDAKNIRSHMESIS